MAMKNMATDELDCASSRLRALTIRSVSSSQKLLELLENIPPDITVGEIRSVLSDQREPNYAPTHDSGIGTEDLDPGPLETLLAEASKDLAPGKEPDALREFAESEHHWKIFSGMEKLFTEVPKYMGLLQLSCPLGSAEELLEVQDLNGEVVVLLDGDDAVACWFMFNRKIEAISAPIQPPDKLQEASGGKPPDSKLKGLPAVRMNPTVENTEIRVLHPYDWGIIRSYDGTGRRAAYAKLREVWLKKEPDLLYSTTTWKNTVTLHYKGYPIVSSRKQDLPSKEPRKKKKVSEGTIRYRNWLANHATRCGGGCRHTH